MGVSLRRGRRRPGRPARRRSSRPGTSPASAAASASSTPCSRPRVTTVRNERCRWSSSASTSGRSSLAAPAAGGGVDDQTCGRGSPCSGLYAGASRQTGDEVGAGARLAALHRLQPAAAESAPQHRLGRVERACRTPAGGDDRVPSGPQHAGHLGEERGHVELGDQVEGVVILGEGGGVADLEGDPPVGIEPDPGLRLPDHLLGDVDAADAAPAGTRARSAAPRSPVPVPMSSARSGAGSTSSRAARGGPGARRSRRRCARPSPRRGGRRRRASGPQQGPGERGAGDQRSSGPGREPDRRAGTVGAGRWSAMVAIIAATAGSLADSSRGAHDAGRNARRRRSSWRAAADDDEGDDGETSRIGRADRGLRLGASRRSRSRCRRQGRLRARGPRHGAGRDELRGLRDRARRERAPRTAGRSPTSPSRAFYDGTRSTESSRGS